MPTRLDKKKYGALLMDTLPRVIDSDEELQRSEGLLDRLLKKVDSLSPEEETLLKLISDLIESYEDRHFPLTEGSPVEVLRFLMEDRQLRQSDLLTVFGSSGIASEVVNGKRAISKSHAKKLAAFFKVPVELFI